MNLKGKSFFIVTEMCTQSSKLKCFRLLLFSGWGLYIALLLMIFSGCNQTQPVKNIFRYNESAGIASLDPAYAKNQSVIWPVHQLYNTLIETNDSLQIKPSIAKSWAFSDSNRVLTFTIRNDVFFHDDPCFKGGKGRRVVAEDVVYSLSRLLDEQVASPGAWIFSDLVRTERPFIAPDDTTVILYFRNSFAPVLYLLTNPYCSIVPKEAILKYGKGFARHPVGTGPFCFKVWEEGQALMLKRNDHYFEKDADGNSLPYLDGISISFLESKSAEFLQFRQQKIDFINDIDPTFKDELLTLQGDLKSKWRDQIDLVKHPYLNTEYLGFCLKPDKSFKNNPLLNRKVRQAISLAIDRQKIMMYLRNGIGISADRGFLPKGIPGFDDISLSPLVFNPDSAKRLIREAGYGSEHPMPEITLSTVPGYASIGSRIVNDLSFAGIKAKVEVVQKGLLFEQMSKSEVDFFRGSWIADYPDPLNFFSVFFSHYPAPPNYTRFSNAAFDSCFKLAQHSESVEVRHACFLSMNQIIRAEVPVIPLWYDEVVHLQQKYLRGFHANSMNGLELKSVKKMK